MLGILAATARANAAPAPKIVVLDPGHGGSNAGTKGSGLLEKQVTLVIANPVSYTHLTLPTNREV